MLVQAAPWFHYGWLKERIGLHVSEGFRAIEALDVRGTIKGMVGYDGWTANSVQMHVAFDVPIALRSILRPAFKYPFLQVGVKYVLGVTPGDRKRALAMNKSLGFREVYRLREGYADGVDLVFQEMTRDECRWIR